MVASPAQKTLPEWAILSGQFWVFCSKEFSQQFHHSQPLFSIITLYKQQQPDLFLN